jgi:hypothetical protein
MAKRTAKSNQEQKLSVAKSLGRHWPWLLAVALFPLVVFLGPEIRVPSEVFSGLWLIVLIPWWWWDYSRCRRPFTLWIVAMGIWMASFCLTVLLTPFGSGTVG